MKDHETMRNEQADRELDLQAALIRAKQEHDRAREHRVIAQRLEVAMLGGPRHWWKA